MVPELSESSAHWVWGGANSSVPCSAPARWLWENAALPRPPHHTRPRALACPWVYLPSLVLNPTGLMPREVGTKGARVPGRWVPGGVGARGCGNLAPHCVHHAGDVLCGHVRSCQRRQRAAKKAPPCTLCSTPNTLCSTPSTICSTPCTLCSTPSTRGSTPSTRCSALTMDPTQDGLVQAAWLQLQQVRGHNPQAQRPPHFL
mmetsp:Transcript_58931/g.105093  ORF Transcript_58931/g.105093 Transcript_58931/m.105093 type:complete len:202 (+) Transcript_58931:1195-1800(+)